MDIASSIARLRPELVGFSCYIWNIENTLKVCSVLKEINEDIEIILGGPEVSYDGYEVMKNNSFVDYVIEGEGEVAFNKFLRAVVDKSINIRDVEGLLYRDSGEIMKNSPSAPIEDLNVIPFPYNELPDKIVYYEATRGCPFNCKYCLSSRIRGLRYFNIERVKRDLKFFIDNKVALVKFVDRTFNANRKFSREIWEFLIAEAKDTKFHFEIAADILDDDTLEFLNSAPGELFQFEVGVQTTNPVILKNINRVMDFERVKKNIIRLKQGNNIHCHLDLIAGLPGEDMESFKKSFNDCMEIKPEVLQLGFLKILKGSPMYFERERYGIRFVKYPPYQVISTESMSFEELDKLIKFEKVFETYYNSEIFKVSMDYILNHRVSAFDFFMEFTDYLNSEGFFDRSFDLKSKFKLLLDFWSLSHGESVFKDILLHDFIINTKKSVIPEFLGVYQGFNGKEILYKNMNNIEKKLGELDMKRALCLPSRIKIIYEGGRYKVLESDGYAIYDLHNQVYCYI